MKHLRDAIRMVMVDKRVVCPICKCGWPVTKQTNLAILSETFAAHVEQHRKVCAVRERDPIGYRERMILED